MKYTYRQRVELARKLKLFLALFFAVSVLFGYKFIFDNSYAIDENYGTATITFNAGDGHFVGGDTTNVVTYNLTKQATMYSHTPNIFDNGIQIDDYAGNLDLNDIVTIPGATSLHVTITYGGEEIKYDWACLWEGSHPEYTAYSNYSSSKSGKLGGGSHNSSSNTKEYTINGDTVTFGFHSDVRVFEDGYGYYAVVTGIGDELHLGDIASGEYKEPIGNNDYSFIEWDVALNTLNSDSNVSAEYLPLLDSGTYDNVDWKLTGIGELIIGKEGEEQTFLERENRDSSNYPWNAYQNRILSISFVGTVNGASVMSSMFQNCPNLIDVELNNYNIDNVQNISHMFDGCESLFNLDISMLNFDNVVNMSYFFHYCRNITEIDMGNINTSNVTSMNNMFSSCKSLTILDLSNFDTTNVTTMSGMFYGCSNLSNLDISNFDTTNVTTMSGMFNDCSSLTALDLSNFNTSNVTSMNNMFSNCKGLTILDLSNFNTTNVTNMGEMFRSCNNLTNLNVSSFNTSNVQSFYNMFYDCGFNTVDISSFDVSLATDFTGMFMSCGSLESINFGNFNTLAATNMSEMFYSCRSLETLDLSSFNTSNLKIMFSMFHGCTSMSVFDIEGFDTSKVTDMRSVFSGCDSLNSIDLSTWNVSSVTDMNAMFADCKNLRSVNLENWNTNSLASMYSMFAWCDKLVEIENFENLNVSNVTNMVGLFHECKSISELDLSSWNTSSLQRMQGMFYGCSNLKTLNLSNFDTSNVTSIFASSGSVTYEYQTSGSSGSGVGNQGLFRGCTNLESLDLSGWDTSNIQSMKYMFFGTENLCELKLGEDFVFLSDADLDKSWIRDGDSIIYTAPQLISSYDGSTMAGTYRSFKNFVISESVRGNFANINKEFSFVFNLSNEDVGINNTYNYSGSKTGQLEFVDGEATFTLKHGESINLNLPVGYNYSIIQDNEDYTLAKSNDSGVINDNISAEFIDTLSSVTPTGLFTDIFPYLIMIVFGLFTMLFITKIRI